MYSRNKTSYEASSFRTPGTPQNVPYTILTHSHIFPILFLMRLFFQVEKQRRRREKATQENGGRDWWKKPSTKRKTGQLENHQKLGAHSPTFRLNLAFYLSVYLAFYLALYLA